MEWIKVNYMCNCFLPLFDVHHCGALSQINHVHVHVRVACVYLVSRLSRKLIHELKLSLLKNSAVWESGVIHSSKNIIAVLLQHFAIINSVAVAHEAKE